MIGEGVYLRTYLAPFTPWLDRPDVTDILVNKPGEVWIDGAGGFERIAALVVDLERHAGGVAGGDCHRL